MSARLKASSDQLGKFDDVLGAERASDSKVRLALQELRDLHVDTECHRLTNDFTDRAVRSLSIFPQSASKKLMLALATYAATREN
jgi:hypothetical protein